MKYKIIFIFLFTYMISSQLSAQWIYYKNKAIGEITVDGDVYIDGTKVGQFESDNQIYIDDSKVGQIQDDGIYKNGIKVGRIESNGDVYGNLFSKIGFITSSGDVYYQDIRIGAGKGVRVSLQL